MWNFKVLLSCLIVICTMVPTFGEEKKKKGGPTMATEPHPNEANWKTLDFVKIVPFAEKNVDSLRPSNEELDAAFAPGGTLKPVFKKLEGGDLFLEVDLPKGKGPFPAVVYIHGGGWKAAAEPKQFKPQSLHMAQRGVAGVRILYRGSKRGGFDETMEDVLDAIDFVRKNAEKYKIDMTRIALAGGSAGGHLSGIAAQQTPECIAYVGFNGLYNVRNIGWGKFGKSGGKIGAETVFLGKITAERQVEISAQLQMKSPPPNSLFLHGTADTTIDPDQSVEFARAIIEKGGKARVVLYEDEVHAFFNTKRYDETVKEMERHLLAVFKMD